MNVEKIKAILEKRFEDCPKAIQKQFESMVDAGLIGVDMAQLSEKEQTDRYSKICPLTAAEREEIHSKIPQLDDEQKRLQVDFIRVLVLLQDIERTAQNFDKAIQSGDFNEGFRELRIGLLAYYLSDDARKRFSRYGKDESEIRELNKKLAPRTTFLAHLRNYITGHLDDAVLEKTCQWGGFSIFTKSAMGNSALMILVNKFLLETGINCCIASKQDDKNVIRNEIDLTYPPDYKYFMQFMSETYNLTVEFLSKVKAKIEMQLKPYGEREAMLRALWAGETDFAIG